MKVITYWGPDSDEEVLIKEQLAMLYEKYREEAKPYLDMLIKIQNSKTPKYFIVEE